MDKGSKRDVSNGQWEKTLGRARDPQTTWGSQSSLKTQAT